MHEEHKDQISELLDDRDESNSWLITYADMVTLLLAFFIVLYAISNLNIEKFKLAISSIQNTIHGSASVQLGISASIPEVIYKPIKSKKQTEAEKILEDLQEVIENKTLEDQLDAYIEEARIIIRIKDQLIFSSGSATLNPTAIPIFDSIIELTDSYPDYDINIKGHTDNIPINTIPFPSNWELSAIRATSVLRYFIGNGVDPMRLTATGYGDLMPLTGNDSNYNRAINRRVEFVLEKNTNKFSKKEDIEISIER
ncbi:MAG: OmpA family protein [Methylococcales bacterium]|jgi:chemotaxis protein MotB|nr:OmpA family protein [Methylococcales bacterium]MBT7409272.1 OmpA family protein [Methylococcales bacterium]